MKYKGGEMGVSQIGKELHADNLLQGSVHRTCDRVRIAVQLIEAQEQTDLWAESYEREVKDILLQDSVARTMANQIRIALTPEQQQRLASPRQLERISKGRYFWNKRTADGLQKAAIYFQQATIDRNPGTPQPTRD